MSHFRHKQNYEELAEKLGGKLPPGYNKNSFTSYAHGQTVVGFKPYREKRRPDGTHDVCITGPNSYVKVELPGYKHGVWASLADNSDYVELLGWGNTSAWLEDFPPSEQAKLKEHRRTRAHT